ncbi:MAG TPA: DUF3226 domain-containing protein [Bryobacteraceae bacterium]|nr:DUF3226 domain-containing protein [Bryobacteraceae bacterium]
MQYSYLVVEGPHDLEFIGRLLRASGLHKVQREAKLGAFWHPLVPRQYPPGGDLLKRVPVPVFFQSASHSVAIHSAGGVNRLVPTVEETRSTPGFKSSEISSVGLFLDADWQTPASDAFTQLKAEIQAIGLPSADAPGTVNRAVPRMGVFIFPDNRNPGTLENLLDDCAALVYRELREKAQQFTAGAATVQHTNNDRKEFDKPAGKMKVTTGCIANFLRPAKAIQTSIEDNRWVCEESLALPRIAALHAFLQDLIGL